MCSIQIFLDKSKQEIHKQSTCIPKQLINISHDFRILVMSRDFTCGEK